MRLAADSIRTDSMFFATLTRHSILLIADETDVCVGCILWGHPDIRKLCKIVVCLV